MNNGIIDDTTKGSRRVSSSHVGLGRLDIIPFAPGLSLDEETDVIRDRVARCFGLDYYEHAQDLSFSVHASGCAQYTFGN